jgi:hypothetical protein
VPLNRADNKKEADEMSNKENPKRKPNQTELGEEIRKRADAIYQQRVAEKKPGDALSDWLKAEREIRTKYE